MTSGSCWGWTPGATNSQVPSGPSGSNRPAFPVGEGSCPGRGWPAGQGPIPGHTGRDGQTVKRYLFLRKLSFPQKKGQGEGAFFLYFLIKCHLLSVKQRSVSCSALGQINISVTWGLWGKARRTRSCQQLLCPCSALPRTQPGWPAGLSALPWTA